MVADPSILGLSNKISDQHSQDPNYHFGCFMGIIAGISSSLRTVITIKNKNEIDTFHNL